MECTYAVACKGDSDNLSCCTQFDPYGNGEKLWKDLLENGQLTEASLDEKLKGKAICLEYPNLFIDYKVLNIPFV